MRDELSVRQWQEQFKAGAFDSPDFATQCKAGWYDWFCNDEALAGRLKKLARVVMGVTDPFILDNYYVWFKNNCPMVGPLYDDVRFEPLSGDRDGKYFVVSLDCPHEKSKWVLYTERYDFDAPEFECQNIREMGYAFDNEESHLGLSCIAVPLLDRRRIAIAAVSLSGQTQFIQKNQALILQQLRKIQQMVSTQL